MIIGLVYLIKNKIFNILRKLENYYRMVFKKKISYKNSSMAVARKALTQVSRLKKEVEIKDVPQNNTVAATNVTLTGTPLFNIAQGLTSLTRIGDKIKPVKMHYSVLVPFLGTTSVRFMVVQAKADKIQAPLIAQLLDSSAVDSYRNEDSRPYLRILVDKLINTNSTHAVRIQGSVKPPRVIQFNSSLSATEPADGGLFFFCFSDSGTAISCLVKCKLSYSDV